MGLILSGLSGSGKSTALHALEDLGCFCTDNLPVPLLGAWAKQVARQGKPMAVCVDARSESPKALHQDLRKLRQQKNDWQLLFLEADDATLLRRYSTLRRRHPYAPGLDLPQAIAEEREALTPARGLADLVLDTTAMNPYELAAMIEAFWYKTHSRDSELPITVTLMSFSYKHGLPLDADMVIDLRFLPNPHYQPELSRKTGRDAPVQAFLERDNVVAETEEKLKQWLGFVWDKMQQERKRYFTLAIGCSGGRHRSVYMVERIAAWMRHENMAAPLIRHRELARAIHE